MSLARKFFTREQAQHAIDAGNQRQDYAEQAGLREIWLQDKSQARLAHQVGAIGEWLAAEEFRLPFDPTVGRLDAVDLKLIEVRARRVVAGRRLPDHAIEPGQKLRLPFVLVHVQLEQLWGEVVGWLCGWEMMERPDRQWNQLCQCYYVPPPYHSVLSLHQWLWCGHRLHWCPEKYRGV